MEIDPQSQLARDLQNPRYRIKPPPRDRPPGPPPRPVREIPPDVRGGGPITWPEWMVYALLALLILIAWVFTFGPWLVQLAAER